MALMLFLFIGAAVAAQIPVPEAPPLPYAFSYAAGRAPGHTDRVHAETSDGNGVIRGMFSYVDPRHQIRTVEYVADQHGFHPLYITNPNVDTKAVAQEKAKHAALFQKITEEQARIAEERGLSALDDGSYRPQLGEEISVPVNPALLPKDTNAVNRAKARHFDLYAKIANEHAQLAYERQLQEGQSEIAL